MELFGLADCNNFYCSCERVFHPDLNGKPVVVLSNNDGCIIARSNESKALGLKMGDVFFQVRDILEKNGVAVFSSNYNLYGDMSRRVMSLLSAYTPKLDQYSIDECFLDLTGIPDLQEYGKDMVRKIKKGTGIPISLGIAQTKTLAKMASRFAKKYKGYEGVCMIDNDEKREKALKLFPIGDVWGIGGRYAKKLEYHGIRTAWDFVQKPGRWVKRELSVVGFRTWQELRGESCISIEDLPHKKSICTSRSFPGAGISCLEGIEEAVADFASNCSRKLREQHTACSSMTVFTYTSRFRTDLAQDYICCNIHFPVSTNNAQEIVAAAVEAVRSRWKQADYRYKKAGVIVWDICKDDEIQGDLFDTHDREKQKRLMEAIDAINLKNGHDTIRLAVQGYSKVWKLKNEFLSKQYTTVLEDILRLKI